MSAVAEGSMKEWERLDEREEYAHTCRARLEHRVWVTEPLALISQVQRSGGTLLSRLFDCHPECHAHPYELKIGPGTKDIWPKLDLADPNQWFEVLYELKAGAHLVEGYSKPGLKKADVDVLPFMFLPRLQKRIFDACIAARGGERERDILDCYMTSYFNAWLDNQNLYPRPKKIVTGFMPMLTADADSLERFFAAYPDGTLLSIVREPRGWYASAARHSRKKYRDVEAALLLWRRSTEGALDAARRLGDRAILVTYEQLVADTEPTMSRLAELLGLTMSPTLLEPTFNGRPVRANSSDPVSDYGIIRERSQAYRDVLDAEKIARVDELGGDLYEQAVEVSLLRSPPGRA
jgi:hypothetical protein